MKKLFLFTFLIIIAGGLFFWLQKTPLKNFKLSAGDQPESSSTSTSTQINGQIAPKLKNLEIKKESPTKYSLKSLNNDLVELGTERHSPPKPFLKLHKWDSEVSLKVTIPYDVVSEDPDTTGGKLTYITQDNKKIEFLSKVPEEIVTKDSKNKEHKFTINNEGGVEFNLILDEKPATNNFIFPLETQNLDFFYQPPLNKEDQEPGLTCTATECKDKDGNIAVFRPENVVGSYAVYYKDNKSGDYSRMGGKNYKAGKAFHIYRPKITDAQGKETWGELKIDEITKILTVTVNQKFLDEAVYPVTVDPNFGYETEGQSTASNSGGAIRGSGDAFTGPDGGTGVSVTVFAYSDFSATNQFGLYKSSDDTLLTNAYTFGTLSMSGSPLAYYTADFVSPPTFAAEGYYIMHNRNTSTVYAYDAVGTNGYKFATMTYGTWSAGPITWSSVGARKFTIYVTYTAAAPTLEPQTNFQGVDMQGVNIN